MLCFYEDIVQAVPRVEHLQSNLDDWNDRHCERSRSGDGNVPVIESFLNEQRHFEVEKSYRLRDAPVIQCSEY